MKEMILSYSNNRIVRFLISGGTSLLINLVFLYLFTDVAHIPYLISSIVAFLLGFLASFSMQKYWTFQNHSHEKIHLQVSTYLVTTLLNLALNTLIVFCLVNYLDTNYLLAQIIASGLIAFESYFVYRRIFVIMP